ncbi:MAG: phage tail tape measure protein [Carnobacterium sp.]
MSKLVGLTVELGADMSKMDASIKGFNKSMKSNFSQLGALRKNTKLDPKDLNVWAEKQTVLSSRVQDTTNKLNELRNKKKALEYNKKDIVDANGLEKYNSELNTVSTQIIKTRTDLGYLTKEFNNSAIAMKKIQLNNGFIGKIGTGATAASQKLGELSSKMRGVSLAAGATIVGVGKIAFDFEDSFANVIKTVDASEQELQGFKKSIIDMSTEIPQTANNIAEVMSLGGQLGIQNANLQKFTRTMVDLDVATNMTSEEAATMAAQFANITKMNQNDFDRFGSSIVNLGNNSATTEKAIMEMAMRVAAGGSQIGLTQDEILGVSTAMASVGIASDAGGTAMTKFMTKTAQAVNKGGKELSTMTEAVGLDAKKFADAWKNEPAEALDMFFTSMNKSKNAGKPMFDMLDELGIKENRMRDTITRLANNPEILSKSFGTAKKGWQENTALVEEATRKYDTFKAKFTKMMNKMKAVAIQTFDKIAPTLTKMVDGVSKGLDGLSKTIDGLNPTLVSAFALGLTGLAAAAPAMFILSKTLGAVGKSAQLVNKIKLFNATKDITVFANSMAGLGPIAEGSASTTSSALSAIKVGASSAALKAKSLATAFIGLGPAGWTAVAVTAAVGISLATLIKRQKDAANAIDGYTDAIQNANKSARKYGENIINEANKKEAAETKKNIENRAKNDRVSAEEKKAYYDNLRDIVAKGHEKILKAEQDALLKSNSAKTDKEIQNKAANDLAANSNKMVSGIEKMNNVDFSKLNVEFINNKAIVKGATKEQQEALNELGQTYRNLPQTSKEAFIKQQKGWNTYNDYNKKQFFLSGQDMTKQVEKGMKSGFSEDTAKGLVQALGKNLKFGEDSVEVGGLDLSSKLFAGLNPEEVSAKALAIKNGLAANLTFDGEEFNLGGGITVSDNIFKGLSPEDILLKTQAIKTGLQTGLTFEDGFFDVEGQKIDAGLFSGLNPEQITARTASIKSLISNGFTFEDGQINYKGQQISNSLFTGMSSTDMTGTLNIIKSMIDNGLNIDLTPKGIKAMNSLKEPLSKIDFSQDSAKVKAQLEKVGQGAESKGAKDFINKMVSDLNAGSTKTGNAAKKTKQEIEKNAKADGGPLGRDFTSGYAAAIRAGTINEVNTAAQEMAESAVRSAKKGQDSNSPSKETFKLGIDFDDGYINAIYSKTKSVEKAGGSIAKAAVRGLQTSQNRKVANSTLENIMGVNRIKAYENMRDKELADPNLSPTIRKAIKEKWDKKIEEEKKQYQRQVAAMKREEAYNSKNAVQDRNIKAAEKRKSNLQKRISKNETKLKQKKTSAAQKRRLRKQIASDKRQISSQNKLISKYNTTKRINEQNYKINDNIAKTKEEIADFQEQIKNDSSTTNAVEASYNKALQKILDNNVLDGIKDKLESISKSIVIDTSSMEQAIKQSKERNSITNNNEENNNVNIIFNGDMKISSTDDIDELVKVLKLELARG